MITRLEHRSLLLMLLGIVATACHDERGGPAEPDQVFQASREGPEVYAPPGSIDAVFLEVNDEVPGFAGMVRENGEPVFLLVEGSRADQARAALHALLPDRGLDAARGNWRQADYEWRDLARWHAAVLPLLTRDDVVFTDANEALNRIMIGVLKGTDEAAVVEEAVKLGVPGEALVLTTTEPPVAVQTLRDRIRPTRGGLRVNEDGPECTLGFNVLWGAVRTFMTAAHCTGQVGQLDGSSFYQDTWNLSYDSIGIEYMDPPLSGIGAFCPADREDCRWSDAALVVYADAVAWDKGGLARTASPDRWNGSRDIYAWFRITGKYNPPVMGDTLHKMGATTGWTYGDVAQTCRHYALDDGHGRRYLMCQDLVNAGVYYGDSGSPVFRRLLGDSVQLAGILWGGDPVGTGPGARFIFSRIGAVEQDFGATLDVLAPPPPPPPMTVTISGPTTWPPYQMVTVTTSVSNGTPPYSYAWLINGAPYPGCGNKSWCDKTMGGPGTSVYFYVTVTGGDGRQASDYHIVMAPY
jgi:hypothetical protein